MNTPTGQQSGTDDPQKTLEIGWEAGAWVYILWALMGRQVYCKIGCSTSPRTRLKPIVTGLPERPFRAQLLPCLSMEQAILFERIFHRRLRRFRTKGEWFTHSNVLQLSRTVMNVIKDFVLIFESFGYDTDIDLIDLGGRMPLLTDNGFVSDVIE